MAGRPRQFDGDAAVDAAVEIFWRKGYATTTPQQLAEQLSIGKGSLYNTFKSKSNLFSLALHRYNERRLQALAEELEADGSVRDRLRSALAMLASIGVHRNGCFAVNAVVELAGVDGEATAASRQLFDRVELALKDAIVRGQRSGELSADRDAWMALLGLKTLPLRMQAHTRGALAVAEFLAAHPAVTRVHHPSRPDHPHADTAARLFPCGTGGMLSFELAGGRPAVDELIRRLGNAIPLSPSLGDVATTLVRPATTTHRSLPSAELEAPGITEGLVRLSIGIEEPADLVAELRDALGGAAVEHDSASALSRSLA